MGDLIKKLSNFITLALMALCFTSCSLGHARLLPINEQPSKKGDGFVKRINLSKEPSVLFVGDPQIHNLYGVSLKLSSKFADSLVRVAIRPPEVNLLARYSLDEILRKAALKNPDLVVVLGDGTNIACTNEFEVFSAIMSKQQSLGKNDENSLWLMAHGNHDSYMQGTINSYRPSDKWKASDWRPQHMPDSKIPTDESWWGTTSQPQSYQKSWNNACYTASYRSGSPMNKVQWIAKYLNILRPHGLTVGSSLLPDVGQDLLSFSKNQLSPKTQVFHLHTDQVTGKLAKFNYRMEGRWTRPSFSSLPSYSKLQKSWDSFIVQSIDLSPAHRLILIDTSVCEIAAGGKHFLSTNAGSKGCIGAAQMKIIAEFAKVESSVKVIIAGHFPLKDLLVKDRNGLLEILNQGQPWDYISAHTHRSLSRNRWNGGMEINIGSTTDWPAEGHIIRFSQVTGRPEETHTLYAVEDEFIKYKPYKQSTKAGICRHIPAAKALAELDTGVEWRQWPAAPLPEIYCPLKNASVEDWIKLRKQLDVYLNQIDYRMKHQQNYRETVLKIFAGASYHESTTPEWQESLP